MSKKFITITVLVLGLFLGYFLLSPKKDTSLPLVAIANWGPHATLAQTIAGLKDELTKQGFIDQQTVRYEIMDVGFSPALIPQMLSALKNKKPEVIVVLGTPIAQAAKGSIKDIPLVYTVVTDPIVAGLIQKDGVPDSNMTGISDKQDLHVLLSFAKSLLPNAKTVGLLYASGQANDLALVEMMNKAAAPLNLTVLAIPVDQPRDIPARMQAFKGKVDFIYVGVSGVIQPTLPAIAAVADRMNIPVFNADATAVKDQLVLGSFGVNYDRIGHQTGEMVAAIIRGTPISKLPPADPRFEDHTAFISKKKASQDHISIPSNLNYITVVE
ncbi:MAG: ABC transporter substrate-binding protein [Pseudomonadota bacterium]